MKNKRPKMEAHFSNLFAIPENGRKIGPQMDLRLWFVHGLSKICMFPRPLSCFIYPQEESLLTKKHSCKWCSFILGPYLL